jgi:hypothetical protein
LTNSVDICLDGRYDLRQYGRDAKVRLDSDGQERIEDY